MRTNLKIPWSASIAISVGLVVLLGYFLQPGQAAGLQTLGVLRDYFLQVAIILAAIALLLGAVNLFSVHWRKIRRVDKNSSYSVVLVIAMLLTIGLGVFDYFMGTLGDSGRSWLAQVVNWVQIPVETSLAAILAVTLAYAAARLLHWRANLLSILFVATALLVLLGSGPEIPLVSDVIRPWIVNVPAVAGARGLLLGVGLGAIATGLRILMGVDRPYGG